MKSYTCKISPRGTAQVEGALMSRRNVAYATVKRAVMGLTNQANPSPSRPPHSPLGPVFSQHVRHGAAWCGWCGVHGAHCRRRSILVLSACG